jgi:hypothetical protein
MHVSGSMSVRRATRSSRPWRGIAACTARMAPSSAHQSNKARHVVLGAAPNNSFKPNLLRSTKAMAEKACHGFGSTTQVGLTQVLGRSSRDSQQMDKSQANAIAQAILEPDLKAQEEVRRKRAAHERSLADRRLVAWFSLPGFAIGAAVASFTGHRFTIGVILGGIAGSLIGWAVVWWRRRRVAP